VGERKGMTSTHGAKNGGVLTEERGKAGKRGQWGQEGGTSGERKMTKPCGKPSSRHTGSKAVGKTKVLLLRKSGTSEKKSKMNKRTTQKSGGMGKEMIRRKGEKGPRIRSSLFRRDRLIRGKKNGAGGAGSQREGVTTG